MVNLPEYPIVEIRTGQYVPAAGGDNWLWQGESRAGYAPPVGDRKPEISSNYDVHLIANRLFYIKEQCRPDDTDAAFFLHLVPVDLADLPDNRRQYGFDNRDFSFRQNGQEADGKCWTQAVLPEYDIAEIRTGQYRPDAGNIWQGAIRPD